VPATVYLDASFLMLSTKFHMDVMSETEKLLQGRVQFAVPAAVLTELKGLAQRSGASGRDARVALELIRRRMIHAVVSGELNADTALIEASSLPNVIIATADSALRRKIRGAGKPVIFLREKAKLELEGIEASYW
jgi:rRNA-processing protein FCF1